MPNFRVYEGKDLDEALKAASQELGIEEDKIHYRLMDEGRRGVFGLGARNLQIRVEGPPKPPRPSKPARQRKPARNPAPKPDPVPRISREPEPARRSVDTGDGEWSEIAATVDRMMELMDIRLEASALSAKGGVRLELRGPDRKMLVQNDAEFINALQFLLNRMSRRAWPGSGRIQVVCEGHRGRRDGELVEEIKSIEPGQVKKTGQEQILQPMNPYERRLVHLTIREFPGLETNSEGNGFMKTIKIYRSGDD